MKKRPDAKLTATVAAYVRAGAFPEVAAVAAGIDPALFRGWIRKGTAKAAREPWKSFTAAVALAAAQARVTAEMAMHKDDPKTWLTKGPGRDSERLPGWAKEVKPIVATTNTTVNLLADPGAAALLHTLLDALVAFPEARKAVIAALNGGGGSSRHVATIDAKALPAPPS